MNNLSRALFPSFVTVLALSIVSWSVAATTPPSSLAATQVSVAKIWGHAPHNAFTDLIRWRNRWYCAFREGRGHVGDRGQLRVISSADGEHWTSAAVLEHELFDLRDANLSITSDGQLMALGGAQVTENNVRRTGTFASFSDDGQTWSPPKLVVPLGRWLWGVTWHEGAAWGVSYPAPDRPGVSALLRSHDGQRFETVVSDFLNDGRHPTEARIRFGADGNAYCLHRRDGKGDKAYLGSAKPPFDAWEWHELDRYLGGPNFVQLPSGEWIAAGRIITKDGPRTMVLYLDPQRHQFTPLLTLPSGGDTSYPGLVWHDGLLWVSYYSSHEGRTSIYLATVRIVAANDCGGKPSHDSAYIMPSPQ